ncbi:MAG: site-2 protease family protein [Candidatus Aenigmarchaeota archaeon]|nr:site-2 protease family protein [Candidatus Aenigmarchaeota archaeon]
MVDWYLVSVLIFAAFLAVLVYLDRKNWKRESILLLRKTQKGKRFLIRLGTRFPRFWLVVGTLAVIITFLSSIWIIWLLIVQTQLLATGQISVGPGILVPSPTSQTTIGPGYFAVPFWYWIISIAVLVIVHEGMHGVMAAREKVRIKSLGWGLLAVIPLAFVEPDEKQLKKQKSWKQLRVFAAGSFANFVVAFASLFVLAVLAFSFFIPAGVGYQALARDYPAAGANMTGAVIGINSYTIDSRDSLSRVLREIGPNQTITVTTTNGTQGFTYTLQTVPEPEPAFTPDFSVYTLAGLEQVFPGTIDFSKSVSGSFAYATGSYQQPTWSSVQKEIKLWEYVKSAYPNTPNADSRIASLESELQSHPRSGFIGIVGVFDSTKIRPGLENYQEVVIFLQGLMFFLFLINLGVGLFNMLPIGPLDGGRMWDIILKRITPKHSKRIMNILTALMMAIIILDFALVLI